MDPSVSLAVSMHANKGIYAVLLGSGVSRDAGIPTGWEIVLDFIRRVAQIKNQLSECEEDPEDWYRNRFGEEPNYSKILEQLAQTPSERQQLLRSYFEPTDTDREEGRKLPTDAHKSLAKLVEGGFVRVIVTTNFDRLMEQALETVGITPIVLASSDAVKGALPLAHARCTIVKVHGDYLDTRLLNTSGELETYDPAVDTLLDQILDEYGLIICGWSAEWDTALRAAIDRAKNRRFSTYWVYPRSLKESATGLIKRRGATPIAGVTATHFFLKLVEAVESLEELAGPRPLSAHLATQTVKRYLTRNEDRIRLHDLVNDEITRVRKFVTDTEQFPLHAAFSGAEVLKRLKRIEYECANLMAMFAVAGYWVNDTNRSLWIRSLERLAEPPRPSGTFQRPYLSLRLYPALLATYSAGIGAISADRIDNLVGFLTSATVRREDSDSRIPLVLAVNTEKVLDYQSQRKLPERERHFTPLSEYLWAESGLRHLPIGLDNDENSFTDAFDRFEYFSGVIARSLYEWAPVGCFVWRDLADFMPDRIRVSRELSAEVDVLGDQHPLLRAGAFGGDQSILIAAKQEYEKSFRRRS